MKWAADLSLFAIGAVVDYISASFLVSSDDKPSFWLFAFVGFLFGYGIGRIASGKLSRSVRKMFALAIAGLICFMALVVFTLKVSEVSGNRGDIFVVFSMYVLFFFALGFALPIARVKATP